MEDEPTPWEDINPTTGLVPRPEPQLPSSDRLEPASADMFRNELTACLTLVAPVGMDEEAKRDWLAVAWATLKHLPADLLALGCKKARETCDHPSKIVPAIVSETSESMQFWRDIEREIRRPKSLPQPPEPEPQYCSPEEAAAILAEFGIKRSWA